jgi:hypothetical protein
MKKFFSWLSALRVGIKTPQAKELGVKVQNDIAVFTYVALPLDVVLADDRLYPWFFERFVQIYGRIYRNKYESLECRLEYFDRYSFEDVLDVTLLKYQTMKKENDIISFIRKKINAGYYLIIYLDEFYLSGKRNYQKTHFIHPSLVYGYDNKARKLKAVGFNLNNQCSYLTFDYDAFSKAYQDGKTYYKDREKPPYVEHEAGVKLLLPKEFEENYQFNIDKFLGELHNYINSTGDDSKITAPADRVVWGIEAYNLLMANIEKMMRGEIIIKYHNFDLMAEHKQIVFDRLKYVALRYGITGQLGKSIEEYNKIVKLYEEIRIKYIKRVFNRGTDGNIYRVIQDKTVFQEILELMNAAKTEERSLLINIYEQLQAKFDHQEEEAVG